MSEVAPRPRVVVVTGAGSGLGLHIARELVAQGDTVLAHYRTSRDELDLLAKDFPDLVHTVKGDIGDEPTAAAIADAAADLGGPDAVISNAGVSRDGLLVRMPVDDWDEVMRVNLRGAFLLTKHVLRPMMRRRSGRLVYVSSAVGHLGNAGQASYAASKAGLLGLAKTVSQEYARYNIEACTYAPGLIDVGIAARMPSQVHAVKLTKVLRGAADPVDVARVLVFLSTSSASHINATGVEGWGGLAF